MLSVERVKELINDPNLSDKEIEEIRDGLHMLAEVMFEQWQAERIKAKKEKEYKDNQNEHEKATGQQQ
jgi:signal-transduction protein with cAMP-binding, CBS, and nucleotidyltransferase domain